MDPQKKKTQGALRQYGAAVVANMAAFCIGTMLGWTSPMQPQLESDTPPVGSEPFTREQISWIGSINFIGAITGTLFWGRVSDAFGRKTTGCLVAVPFALSWAIILLAQNSTWILIGRYIMGVGCSGAVINTPMFVTEIAQDKIRGQLGSFLMSFLNTGCLFCYVIGSYLSFQTVNAICLAVPIAYAVIFFWMPESPVFLYRKNKRQEAETSMLWYRGGDIVQTEIEMTRLQERAMRKTVNIKSLWANIGTIKAMFIGFGFVFGQQLCGILAILTYTVMIFKVSGSSLPAYLSGIVVGSLQVLSSFSSSLIVDKAGRRVLLMVSYLCMSVALITLGWFFYQKESLDESFNWIPISCLSIHVIAYSLGAGPVPFIVMAETFSPEVRGIATSTIQFVSTLLSFITVKTFHWLKDLMGAHGCFWFYGFWCIVLFCFTMLCVPETKGKPLNAILKKLNGESGGEDQEMFTVNSPIQIITAKDKEQPKIPV